MLSTGAIIGICIAIAIVCFLIGGILAFFISKKMFQKQLKENPPITEKMIRVMFAQMGRKASEKQIRSVMNSMNKAR
ncbi:YneF family protein [Mycoplasma phocimorsus]|uniref:YneF family protein n=1 Tax=Mycoplasma phocimorsus TaxID=3045839 RepID=A0AAJ1PT21_9MOLU|nr:YneF family protein [Mycoplasma phocimorsus]MDJ1646016.1 YneF family protein [Mycoplasma phocimorsus]MDJ1646297.1 YneF family protein [Mycoplasma phocimorsus]MDJ1646902.1 YneF family protein [Mycoplasma phocimorsus]MDJ1647869.1 YneF family protein [Mycoplasma phocimorsus]MDJ1648431.1 YneF family protein [Mycoplasma phocimorsus]